MLIQKELNRISTELQKQTGCVTHNISAEIEDEQITVWVTLYDSHWDNSYIVSVTVEESTLKQFSNDRNVVEIVKLLVSEWTDVAKDNMTIH
ncbi:hypothetical protein NVP1161O_202 [Vibrio phage 1.161.O._10N.261.48.C5]|nr:hypothetical protein NVP1161O_202 [Vibrio phage 1.161.O._10N.261.48.C5]